MTRSTSLALALMLALALVLALALALVLALALALVLVRWVRRHCLRRIERARASTSSQARHTQHPPPPLDTL